MPRLPQPGADSGTWGDLLNEFLLIAHNSSGGLRDGAVGDATVAPGANIAKSKLANLNISDADVSTISQSKISGLTTALAGKIESSMVTTKGDLLAATGSSALARLGVGSNHQVLKANSVAGTGLVWADDIAANVRDYGATGDGATDDSVAVQAACDSGKSLVFFPAGTYIINTTLAVPSHTTLSGTGYGSHLKRTVAGDIIAVAGTSGTHKTNVVVRDLRLSGPSTQAASIAGGGLYFTYSDDCVVDNVWSTGFGLTNSNDGGVYGSLSTRLTVVNSRFYLNANGVVFGTPSASIGIDQSIISNNHCYSNWEDGIHSQQGAYLTITGNVCSGNGAVNSGSGIDLLRDVGDTVTGNVCRGNGGTGIEVGTSISADQGHTISGNICDSNAAGGITCVNLARETVISGNSIRNNGSAGINIATSGGTNNSVEYVSVTGNMVIGNTGSGINVSGTGTNPTLNYCILTGNICKSNGSHGILLTANVDNCIVLGNICVSNTQYGIRLSSQSSLIPDNNVIATNYLASNTSGQLSQSGDVNTWVMNNRGVNPQGVATITIGASPYTYIAGSTPEVVYISGGTVSAVVKNAITVFSSTNVSVTLAPGESLVVTYSAAPTMTKDRK